MRSPPLRYDHMLDLTDDVGIFEHAEGAVARRHLGYCLDDVARALVVACRQPAPGPGLRAATTCYLDFVGRAQAADGSCHNRLATDGDWQDEPSTGDWWGRALWGLGTAAARADDEEVRATAARRFAIGATARSPWSRSMAFAALGAGEILDVAPGDEVARSLLAAVPAVIGAVNRASRWPWPGERLRYANASVAEALLVAGEHLDGRADCTDDGLELLAWLLDVETVDDHLSLVPAGGWSAGEARPGFDQQPIEAAAMAEACARALRITGDDAWRVGLERCVAWFEGDNDSGAMMWDPETGGGYDGLEPGGRNDNRGAESTLAALATFQLAARHDVAAARSA